MMGAGERGAILLGESTTRVGSDEAIVGFGDVQSSDVRLAKGNRVGSSVYSDKRKRRSEESEAEMSSLTMWWSDQTQDAGAVVSAGTGTKYRHY